MENKEQTIPKDMISIENLEDEDQIVTSGGNGGEHTNLQEQNENLLKLKKIVLMMSIVSMLLFVGFSDTFISRTTLSKEGGMMDLVSEEIKKVNAKESIPRENEVLDIEQPALLRDHRSLPPPFSTLDPVANLNLKPYLRSKWSSPGQVFGRRLERGQSESRTPLPTNEWYQNMILMSDEETEPSDEQRVYTVPYVVKTNGPVAGIKLCSTRILALDRVVQITYVDTHGLTLGAAENFGTAHKSNFGDIIPKRFTIFDEENKGTSHTKNRPTLTPLGFTLKWVSEIQGIIISFQQISPLSLGLFFSNVKSNATSSYL